jgi:putative membrane-bound dehydrogenase-like protein
MKWNAKLGARLGALLLIWFCGNAVCAAEQKKPSAPPPRVSAPQSADAPGSFQVERGFRVELAAAEPMVSAPVALAFDERGRLFVAEMRDYPDRREQSPHLGQVRMLDDMDDSGAFHTSTIYAGDLPWPSAVACYQGGIFVAATPQILYLKDSKGDGIADVVKVVFTGFGGRLYTPDPTALLNNFNWGLDNRLHCGTAGLGGMVNVLSAAQVPSVALGDGDFAFDPRTLAVVPEAGPARTGMSFDNRGRKFLCDSDRPLRVTMYEPRYLSRNPFFAPPPELLDAASPATAIYRFPAARPASRSPGAKLATGEDRPLSTNTLVAGWLRDARGCVVYRGGVFGANYFGNVFVAAPDGHLIHRFVPREHGLEVAAERPDNERQTEFLLSKDESFQPAQIVNGPDGALYIADFRLGNDTGAIYRIVPEAFTRPAPPRLDHLSTSNLVVLLAQTNGWLADTAARLLYEKRDAAAAGLLENMLNNSRLPVVRLRALHALDGLGALSAERMLRALKDGDERVRQHAVLLAERFAAPAEVPGPLWERLRTMAEDPSIGVRYQLAFSLGELGMPERDLVLAELLARDLDNPWMRGAVLSSLGEGAATFLTSLAGVAPFGNTPAGQEFLAQLATAIGVRGNLEDVTLVLDLVAAKSASSDPPYGMLRALGEGLHRSGSSLRLVDKANRLQRFFDAAIKTSVNDAASLPSRVDAVRLLGINPADYVATFDWLRLLLLANANEPYALESAVLAARGRCDDAYVAPDLIRFWSRAGLPLRNEAMMALLARGNRAGALLDAIESRTINAAALPSTCLNLLRTDADPAIRGRAVELLGPVPAAHAEMVAQFEPALHATGDASHGRELFLGRCAACHRLGGEGQAFGPDLAGAKVRGRDAILRAILEPNREVRPSGATCVVETREGERMVGIKVSQGPSTLTLRCLDSGATVWLLEDIQALDTQSWSLMPEGLEQGLSLQDMADLLDYVLTAVP